MWLRWNKNCLIPSFKFLFDAKTKVLIKNLERGLSWEGQFFNWRERKQMNGFRTISCAGNSQIDFYSWRIAEELWEREATHNHWRCTIDYSNLCLMDQQGWLTSEVVTYHSWLLVVSGLVARTKSHWSPTFPHNSICISLLICLHLNHQCLVFRNSASLRRLKVAASKAAGGM